MKFLKSKTSLLLVLFTIVNAGFALMATGFADQLVQLARGERIHLPGYLVTCDLSSPNPVPQPGPGSTVYYNGEYLVFSRGPAGQLVVRYLNTGRSRDLGGQIKSDPVAFVDHRGAARVIAVGMDDTFFSRTLTTDWEAYGGQLLDAPIVVTLSQQTYIVGRGLDSAVYFRTLDQSWVSLGGAITSPLSVTAIGNDLLIQGVGTDGRYYDRTLSRGWALSE